MSKFIPKGLGWIPDLPDARDYTYRHVEILPLLQRLNALNSADLPDEVDLRFGDEGERFFTDVEDQGQLDSSTAFAVLGLVEYFERRISGRTFDGSKLFLYKVARNLRNRQSKVSGDTGADLRTTLKALRQFGVVDDDYWPYDPDRFDEEPSAFVYQAARAFDDLRYFRIDGQPEFHPGEAHRTRWEVLTSFLAAGFPFAFGFSVPSSLSSDPNIPHRPNLDGARGGQCALAIGYCLNHFGRNHHALLIRTSWGKCWGNQGVGWLSAKSIEQHLTGCFWTLISENWAKGHELSRPF